MTRVTYRHSAPRMLETRHPAQEEALDGNAPDAMYFDSRRCPRQLKGPSWRCRKS
jgi:hypothetical protein